MTVIRAISHHTLAITVGALALVGCGMSSDPRAGAAGTAVAPLTPLTIGQPTANRVVSDFDDRNSSEAWIKDCVRYVQVGAYKGDPKLTTLWKSADSDPVAVRVICEHLSGVDFSELRHLTTAAADVHPGGDPGEGTIASPMTP